MGEPQSDDREQVLATARRAREAAVVLRQLTRNQKDAALRAMADALDARAGEIVVANQADVERAEANGTTPALIDRLTLTAPRIAAIAQALRDVAG
ncbi:MAG: gamma-glutamyl-phosphate reductase, partial [Actinomycetota bacterium]|nr:gamma-glutamyl-phosphate reductase [Actinomycetota bacterium]